MEFYLPMPSRRKILLTLDSGHFHPTETIADKISRCCFIWMSSCCTSAVGCAGTATMSSPSRMTCKPLPRRSSAASAWKVHIGLDYFDASINRLAA